MKNISVVEKIGILLLIIGFISIVLLRVYSDNLIATIANYGSKVFVFGASIWAVGFIIRFNKNRK